MGKTRRTGDLVTDNNLYVNPTTDSFHIGTGCTIYGGSVGIVSAISYHGTSYHGTTYHGDGSNLTGLTGAGASTYGSAGAIPVIIVSSDGRITGISTVPTSGGGGSSVLTTLAFLNS